MQTQDQTTRKRRYTATPDQIAAKKEKMRMLKAHLEQFSPEQRAQIALSYGIKNPEGHTLSPTNQILIAFQLSQFSIVAGFQQWGKYGRSVKKGERGAAIWIPLNTNKQNPEDEAAEINFSSTTVFDISQTEELTTQIN